MLQAGIPSRGRGVVHIFAGARQASPGRAPALWRTHSCNHIAGGLGGRRPSQRGAWGAEPRHFLLCKILCHTLPSTNEITNT